MKCFVREAIKELERAGYIVRSRERDEKGRLRGADYVIYALPINSLKSDLFPILAWRGIFCYNCVAIFFQKFQ